MSLGPVFSLQRRNIDILKAQVLQTNRSDIIHRRSMLNGLFGWYKSSLTDFVIVEILSQGHIPYSFDLTRKTNE